MHQVLIDFSFFYSSASLSDVLPQDVHSWYSRLAENPTFWLKFPATYPSHIFDLQSLNLHRTGFFFFFFY